MLLPKQKIVLLFRYIWLLLAVVVILYIAQQNIVIERQIDYKIDLSQSITRDIEGPYPVHRVSLNPDNTLAVLAEPLYLQVYTPTRILQKRCGTYQEPTNSRIKCQEDYFESQCTAGPFYCQSGSGG